MVYFYLNFYKNKWLVWDLKGTTSSLTSSLIVLLSTEGSLGAAGYLTSFDFFTLIWVLCSLSSA
jgi:hypothetical protein